MALQRPRNSYSCKKSPGGEPKQLLFHLNGGSSLASSIRCARQSRDSSWRGSMRHTLSRGPIGGSVHLNVLVEDQPDFIDVGPTTALPDRQAPEVAPADFSPARVRRTASTPPPGTSGTTRTAGAGQRRPNGPPCSPPPRQQLGKPQRASLPLMIDDAPSCSCSLRETVRLFLSHFWGPVKKSLSSISYDNFSTTCQRSPS